MEANTPRLLHPKNIIKMLVKIGGSIQQHTNFRMGDHHNPPVRFKQIIVEGDTVQFVFPHPIQRAL